MKHNGIVVDANTNTAFDKFQNFDLLNVTLPEMPPPNRQKLKFNYKIHKSILETHKAVVAEMKTSFAAKRKSGGYNTQQIAKFDIIGAVCEHLEVLTTQEQLECMGREVFQKYKAVFELIPHVDDLPTDVYC